MKHGTVAIAKVTPPELPEIIPRERLFQLLDHKDHYGITWISGMAGSGKTTLAASYLTSRALPCLWYRMDERDAEVSTFFYYMGMAVRKAVPRMRKPLPLLTPECFSEISTFTQRYFEHVCNKLTPRHIIVFDDYHNIPLGSRFHDIFRHGLSKVSPDIHVIVLSRGSPPSAFTSLQANNIMRIIGATDLNLTREETETIIKRQSGKPLPSTLIEMIHEKNKGWAAGLILMAQKLKSGELTPNLMNRIIPSEIYDYFAGELFDGMDDTIKDFLLKTAVFPTMTASMAHELTGRTDARHILSFLRRNHLFIERFPAAAYSYQYHPLFRTFLQSRAADTFKPEIILRTKQRAATLLENSDRVEDAVELFCELEDTAALIRLIHSRAKELITHGRLETLQGWLKAVPEKSYTTDPWLLFWRGMSCPSGAVAEARKYYERAFDLFQQAKNLTGTYLSWSRIIDSIVLAWNDFYQLDHWIEWLDGEPRSESSLPPEVDAKVASSMTGAVIIRKPHHPALTAWIARTLDAVQKIPDIRTRLQAHIWAITYCMWIGNYDQAEIIKEKTQMLIHGRQVSPVVMQFWQWIDISMNVRTVTSLDTSLNEIFYILEESDKRGRHAMDHMFFPTGMFAALMHGDFLKAEKLLTRFKALPEDSHHHSHAIFHHFAGLYYMMTDRKVKAIAHAETALAMGRQTGYVFYEILFLFQMAHILCEQDQSEKASAYLARAYSLSLKVKSFILQFMCLLENARIALKEGDQDTGLKILGDAMSLGRKNHYMTMIWWWHSDFMAAMCATALRAGIEVDYAQALIRLHNLTLEPAPFHIDNWPWPLRLQTFERFQFARNGQAMQFNGKAQKRPLDLIKFLIAHGGCDVGTDRIIDEIWPDTDGDKAQSAFSTTLNRLRKLVGFKEAIRLQDGKVSLDRRYCWVDIWAFQHFIADADRLWQKEERQQACVLYEKAISLYTGHFLAEDLDKPWAITARERFKYLFLNAITKLAMGSERDGDFEKAIACYTKGLDVDNLEERFYQRLMVCHISLGQHARALKTYQRCRDTLQRVLDIAPSEKTERIHHRVRQAVQRQRH